MKKITTHPLNRFILTLMLILPALIMVTLVCVTQASAQNAPEGVYEAWVARYDGPAGSSDEVAAIAVDGSGNVYITGWSYGGSATSSDYATIKYDTNGNQLWLERYNGPASDYDDARALAVDGSGNVYVTGRSVRSGTGADYATIKYDTDGNQIWVAFYNGPGMDIAKSIALDSSGNVYVTGSSFGSGTDTDYATIKYDKDGNQIWVKRYHGPGNSEDSARVIAVDGTGNVYVTGVSIGDGTYYDYATIKYDPDGNQLWVKRYTSPGNESDGARDLALDGSGNVYVTGSSHRSGYLYDSATIKYDPDGNELWVQRYDGGGDAIAVDGAGNVYIACGGGTIKYDTDGNQLWVASYYSGLNALALDGSGNVYVTGDSSISFAYATMKYDTDGNELWVKYYDDPASDMDDARDLALDGSGNVYVTGISLYGGTFDYATVKYAPFKADFSASPTSGPAPLNVKFTDKSPGNISSWEWDFGDGSSSTEQNPSHTYTDPGLYAVTLAVSWPEGSDAETKSDYIKVSYIPGDINDDGYVDLGDAVLALQVMSGTTSAGAVYKEADVNGDNKIGLEEVLYVMQKVTELR